MLAFSWWLLLFFGASFSNAQQVKKPAFVSLQRMDAIADLAALALKYFSEDKYLEQANYVKTVFATSEAVTAVAMELSSIWDESGSAAYTLTRMAKLIDERGDAGAQFSTVARIIRAMASSSLERNVHMSVAGSEDDFEYDFSSGSEDGYFLSNDLYKSGQGAFDKNLWRIEQLYRSGELEAADELVEQWISERWSPPGKAWLVEPSVAFNDINEAAVCGHYATLSAFSLLGRQSGALENVSSQQKASIAKNLMNATDAQLAPAVMKWLLTVETFREDQLTLLQAIEEAAKVSLKNGRRNSITELFAELEQIPQENDVKRLLESVVEVEKVLQDSDSNVQESNPNVQESKPNAQENNQNVQENNQNVQESDPNSEETPKTNPKVKDQEDNTEPTNEREEPENEPIKSQGTSNDSDDQSGPWYLLVSLIVVSLLIICLSFALYFLRNFRLRNVSRPNF